MPSFMQSVLIIEDDPDMQALERMALECGGYAVTSANNGVEGLQRLRGKSDPPCAIVLDLMMPVMDGLTFLATRERDGIGADVPVICVTAAGPELMEEARQLGAVACVEKPANLDELCALVGRYCN